MYDCLLFTYLKLFREKGMGPHSSILAWEIPWTEEPGRLQSMGSLGVGHDWVTSVSFFTFMRWRRKWQPTPVFLPGESQGWGKPGGLPSMRWHRVGHDWSDLAAAALTFMTHPPGQSCAGLLLKLLPNWGVIRCAIHSEMTDHVYRVSLSDI